MPRSTLAWGGVVGLAVLAVALLVWPSAGRVSCGPGFVSRGARCALGTACPAPLVQTGERCEARGRVAVARARLSFGPSDWEAEGRVAASTVEAGPFWIDAFEATTRDLSGSAGPDPLRAASGLSRAEASAYCVHQGGRLPTEEEWIVAAAGLGGHRYPWGETGAVCRRAVFGLAHGPCSLDGDGPDTVGAHTDGDTSQGIHDLAGNVAEWVSARPDQPRRGVAKGGSWRSELATELRVWAKLDVDPDAHDDRIGVRCAYDSP